MNNKIAFKTGKVYELEMVKNAFKEAGIPHFVREDSITGLQLSIPLTPIPGPGVFFLILVPEIAFEDARAIIKTLPVEQGDTDDIWHFNPPKEGKLFFKMEARFYAVIFILMFIFFIARLFTD